MDGWPTPVIGSTTRSVPEPVTGIVRRPGL